MNILENKLTPLQEAVRAFSQSEEEKAGVPHIKNAYKGHVVNQLIENTLVNQAGEGFTHTRLNALLLFRLPELQIRVPVYLPFHKDRHLFPD